MKTETVEFRCQACRTWLTAASSRIGEEITCPECKERTVIRLPKVTPPASPAQAVRMDIAFIDVFKFAVYFAISNLLLAAPFILLYMMTR